MKNSKLLLTSLLAAATMGTSAYADIYINFDSDGNYTSEGRAMDGNWNNTAGNRDTVNDLIDFQTGATTGASVTYSSKNTWQYTNNVTKNVLKGYLDDGDSGVSITVSDVPYLVYSVNIYGVSDNTNNKLSYKTVNGVNYTKDASGNVVIGTDAWGAAQQTEINANNTLTVSGLTGDLSISSIRPNNNGPRACIAGIQIINTYTGTAHAATLGSDSAWTTSNLGSDTWTNSTTEAGKYADVTLSADVNLSASAEIVTDGIVVSGGHTLTLSAAEGNTAGIDLIGPGVVRVEGGSMLSLASGTVLNFSGAASQILGAVSGTGSLVAKSASSLNLSNAMLTNFRGMVSAESGATVNFGGGFAGVDFTSGATLGTYNVSFASDSNLKFGLTAELANSVKLGQTNFAGRVNITAGRFTINESDIGDGTWVLEDGVILRQNGTTVAGSTTYDSASGITTINNDMVVNSGTVEFQVNAGGASANDNGNKLIYAGNVSGAGTLKKTNDGVVDFTGNVNLGGFQSSAGRTNFNSSSTVYIDAVTVAGGTVNFNTTAELGGITATGGTTNFRGTGAFTVTGIIETKNGAVVNQTSGVANAQRLVLHNSPANGADTYNLSGGVLNITSTSTVADNTAAVLVGHWSSGSGALKLSGTGVLNVAGGGVSASHTSSGSISISGDSELNAYVLHLKSQNSSSAVTVSENGRLNLGAGGFDNTSATNVLTFDGGTLGTFADAFSSSDAVSLGANGIIVDTEKRTLSKTGASSASGAAASITLNGVLSGTGGLTKRGTGTLTLGGENTYSGATTVEAGTLVAGNATAFGSADTAELTVKTGAAVRVDTGVSLKNLTLESGTRLLLGNLAAGGTAFRVSGMASVAENLTIDAFWLASGTYFVVSDVDSIDWSWLDESNFVLNGTHQTISNINTTTSAFTISFSNIDLVWNGTDGDTWSNGGEKVWTVADSETVSDFMNGDNVRFGKNASVAVAAGGVTAGTVTIASGKTVTLTDGNLTVSDRIVLESGSSTLALGAGSTNNAVSGSGTVAVVGNVTGFFGDAAQSTISLRDAGEDAKFTGTVELRGVQAIVSGNNASTFGSASKIVLNSAALHFNNAAADFTKDIEIKDGQNGYIRSYANNKIASERGATISGNVSGAGTLTSSDDGDVTFKGTVNIGAYVGNKTNGISVFKGDSTTIGTLTVNSGVTARFGGATATVNGISCVGTLETIDGAGTLNVFGTASVGTLRVGAGTVNLGGTATGTTTLAANAGILNIGSTWNLTSGVVLGGTINIDGGTLTLTGTNTKHTATFKVNEGGTLRLAGHDALGYSGGLDTTGKIVLQGSSASSVAKLVIADNDGAGNTSMTLSKEIQLKGYTEISNETGSSFNSWYGKITASGTNNMVSSEFKLGRSFTVSVETAGTLEISGNISHRDGGDNDRKLIKEGLGELVLSGSNSFANGVTVSAGKLVVKSANALGASTGTTTVAADASLAIASGVTITNAGTISLSENAKLVVDLSGKASATETFTLNLVSGTALKYNENAFEKDCTSLITQGIVVLEKMNLDGWTQSLSYSGNTLQLTMTIPEPSTFGLLAGLGALALAGTRRRRRKA